jgi:hypothetical protein
VKALSLTQPWATAIATGLKHWETRSWAKDFAEEMGLDVAALPVGRIVCVADLTECRQTATLAPTLSYVETQWGDYAPGRFAFKFENVRVLPEPVFATGALGFWAVGWDEAIAVIRGLKRVPEIA